MEHSDFIKQINQTFEHIADDFIEQVRSGIPRRHEFSLYNKGQWAKTGDILREKRCKIGLSQRDLAKILGTSSTRIGRIERGDPVGGAQSLIKCYQLAIDYLELKNNLKELVIRKEQVE